MAPYADLLDLLSWRKPWIACQSGAYKLPVWPQLVSLLKAHNRWPTVAHVSGASVDVSGRGEGNPGREHNRKECGHFSSQVYP